MDHTHGGSESLSGPPGECWDGRRDLSTAPAGFCSSASLKMTGRARLSGFRVSFVQMQRSCAAKDAAKDDNVERVDDAATITTLNATNDTGQDYDAARDNGRFGEVVLENEQATLG